MNPMTASDGQVDQIIGSAYQVIKYVASNMETLISLAESVDPLVNSMQTAFEALRRSYAESGFELQKATFKTGGAIGNGNHLLLDDTTGIAYSWGGYLPYFVPKDSTVESAGGIGQYLWTARNLSYLRSALASPNGVNMVGGAASLLQVDSVRESLTVSIAEALRRSYESAGYNVVGSFESGFAYVNTNDIGIHLATGKGYSGSPGPVPAGTNPAGPGFIDCSESITREFNTIGEITSSAGSIFIGQRVRWAGYYNPSDGGGNWGIVKSGAHVHDGGSIFSITPTLYVEANLKGKRISVLKFGAKRNEPVDTVDAFQRCVNYASLDKQDVYAPSGTYLFDRLTFIDPTGLYAQRGQNVFGMVFAKSNVTVTGDKNGTVIKVADGQLTKTFNYVADVNSGTYQNHAMPGTKGFQIFVQNPSDPLVNNFNVEKLTIDMNGYNNKVFPLNAFGNQSQCMAMYLASGSGNSMYKVTIKDAPGSQVLAFWSGTSGTKISKCKFMDCGYLDGTNTNLDDHSTIFSLGTDAEICNNELTQSVQWVGKGGSPIEMHGTGIVSGNKVVKYLSMGVAAAFLDDADIVFSNNIGKSITALGLDLYCLDLHNLKLLVKDNVVEITKIPLSPSHPAYKYRSFVVSPNINNPGKSEITLEGNTVSVMGTATFTDVEATYNSVVNSKLIDVLKIRRNTFAGFKGPVLNLKEQKATASILVEANNFDSCGRKDDYVSDNSIVNYDNGGNVSYGNTPFAIRSKGNVFTSCVYSSYLSMTGTAVGVLLGPATIQVDGDCHDRWVTTINTIVGGPDLPNDYSAYKWVFNYSVIGDIDAVQVNKVFPSAAANYTKAQRGKIEAQITNGGTPASFRKIAGVIDWNCHADKFGAAAPVAIEVSPFGAKAGDRLNVINAVSGNGAGYYCTAAGSVGTWKTFGLVS